MLTTGIARWLNVIHFKIHCIPYHFQKRLFVVAKKCRDVTSQPNKWRRFSSMKLQLKKIQKFVPLTQYIFLYPIVTNNLYNIIRIIRYKAKENIWLDYENIYKSIHASWLEFLWRYFCLCPAASVWTFGRQLLTIFVAGPNNLWQGPSTHAEIFRWKVSYEMRTMTLDQLQKCLLLKRRYIWPPLFKQKMDRKSSKSNKIWFDDLTNSSVL